MKKTLLIGLWLALLSIGIFAWAPARVLSSLVLVVAAWLGSPTLIAAGMSLGFLGDVAIAELLFAGPLSFYVGMLFFALGHVCYIRAFSPPRAALLVPWLVFGVVAWWLVMFDPASFPGALPLATLGYTLLLATMTGTACGVSWPVAVGGALFLFSDLFLGMSLFKPQLYAQLPAFVQHTVIWLLYGPAQALIVFRGAEKS